jgi:branched-chain amino acid transport system ATP-binding protein
VDWAISVCGLEDVVDRFPSEISHGKRKLVGVGRALALEPRLVLLDEPAAGLDTDESLELGQKLQAMPREHGVTVFLIDHDMGLVLSVCDQLMVLDFGRQIASGTPTEIRQNQDVIEAYLGTRHGDDSH